MGGKCLVCVRCRSRSRTPFWRGCFDGGLKGVRSSEGDGVRAASLRGLATLLEDPPPPSGAPTSPTLRLRHANCDRIIILARDSPCIKYFCTFDVPTRLPCVGGAIAGCGYTCIWVNFKLNYLHTYIYKILQLEAFTSRCWFLLKKNNSIGKFQTIQFSTIKTDYIHINYYK